MFEVNPDSNSITMHRGDTGSVMFSAIRTSGEPFGQDDVALWTVRNSRGVIVMQSLYSLADENLGNGKVLVQFHNSSTDQMPLGTYYTEMRYVINPYYDNSVINPHYNGPELINGDIVRTPSNGQGTLTIRDVYGEV